MTYTVLIVEDDADIIDMLSLYLDSRDFTVLRAHNGEEAMQVIQHHPVDIALVDIMMPQMNGYELIKHIRAEYTFPILILSAKSEDNDKVLGLNIGADAYITKPFNPFEVIAYIHSLMRRYYELGAAKQNHKASSVLAVGELTLDLETFVVRKNEDIIPLTSSELKILSKLMHAPGRVYTKLQLYECINEDYYESDENTIMVHISNIRSKIEENPSNPMYIKTVRGLGYKIEKD